MPLPEQRFRWTWDFKAPPEALWPLVSNTDRFNRDCGFPSVAVIPPAEGEPARGPGVRLLRAVAAGVSVVWEEREFEWTAPTRFTVERNYRSGPVARMVTVCELAPGPSGGTTLSYELQMVPAHILGRLILPFAVGRRVRATTERVLRRYDQFALAGQRWSQLAQPPSFAPGGRERLDSIARALVTEAKQPGPLVDRLTGYIAEADDVNATRMRPYALADEWRSNRRDTLDLFLHATRAGLLDFSWDLICPHCRGSSGGAAGLSSITAEAHCPSCNIDFTANFDQSVELTFNPNPSVRSVARADYCVGGPQVTPHIVAQKRLGPGGSMALRVSLEPGRYRVRAAGVAVQPAFRVESGAPAEAGIRLGADGAGEEPGVAPEGTLTISNAGAEERLAIVERTEWSDQSTTAVDVTSRQLFRDLFSREVLRQGEKISVGSMTVVFTDLKNSTQMYVEIGDAPAFGRVLTHFEILKSAVDAGEGCLVKTMGDAVMAVFTRPVAALGAILEAQRRLANPPDGMLPLALKCGIHCGPCLAINQNDRLDYFGTTVNIGARLCALCTGTDLIVSDAIRRDAEISALLDGGGAAVSARPETTTLKGFAGTQFKVWRLEPAAAVLR